MKLPRNEEELRVEGRRDEKGRVRARKIVSHERVQRVVPRGTEHAEGERVVVEGPDSGLVETLPDGSVSIPVFEEQLVVDKRLIVRERVIVRKHTVYEEHHVEADLRRERVEVEVDPTVEDRVVEETVTPRPRRQRPLRAKT